MFVLERPYTIQLEIKKSRFIARSSPVNSVEDAMDFIETTHEPQANHNCWAYKIGDQYRFSDDGEPGGTAGKPIFNAIESQQFDQIVVVVTRYFGGIKLGTGGLIRAYGAAAASCLREAPQKQLYAKSTICLEVDFTFTGQVYALLNQFAVEKLEETYTDTGLILKLAVNESDSSEFTQSLTDACQGKINWEKTKTTPST